MLTKPKVILATFIFLILSSTTTLADIDKIYTVLSDGNYGCQTKENFEKLTTIHISGDIEALKKQLLLFYVTGDCLIFTKGDQVYREYSGFSIGKVKLRKKGESNSYWTFREAIFE